METAFYIHSSKSSACSCCRKPFEALRNYSEWACSSRNDEFHFHEASQSSSTDECLEYHLDGTIEQT